MAETLAGTAITSFVEGLINSNLTALASKEVGLLLGVRGEISYIMVELEMMKPLLRCAEEKQETDPTVRVWVRCLKEVSLDIEDCMDKFTIYLKRRPNNNFTNWLGYRVHSLSTLRVRHEIAAEIQDHKNRIVHISECRLRYGITATASSSSNSMVSSVYHRLGALFVQEAQLVGIDEPKDDLTNLLKSDEQQRMIITVLGMGGLGKTTLAKRVYDSLQVTGGFFDCRAWVAVSQAFNLSVLLRDIIKQLSSPNQKKIEDLGKMQEEKLIEELRNLLQEKRYILVLDDIWNVHAWDSLKYALPENNKGSRVIVTTRIEDVANNCCVSGFDYIHKLQLLSKEKSMELFNKRVFGPGKECPEHLKKAANDIVVKCGGLPLAIVVIAGVLASKPNLDDHQQWSNLLSNLPSKLETNPSLEGMKQVLLLSYNHLPYLIKPCFLYLSIFPEDHLIKRKPLIQLWVAEGLVTNNYDTSAEDVAEYYFNELVGRSLILPSVVGWDGKVKSCRIHDIMLDVLVSKSREENMVSILGKQSRTTLGVNNVIRRLSLQAESTPITEDVDLSRVRSLLIYDCNKFPTFLPRLRLLRVLVLENYDLGIVLNFHASFLRIMFKLRHLRYLSLKGINLGDGQSSISKSLGKLLNLETLDIRNTWIHILYPSVAKLGQLRHLLLGNKYVNKRIYGSMQAGVLKNLKGLETLVGLNIDDNKTTEELGCLTQLKKLVMMTRTRSNLGSICASLNKLSGSLLSLSINIGCDLELPQDLNLFSSINPPSLLQSLTLDGFPKLPDWVGSLRNLAKLTMPNLDDLEVIKTLPNLLCFCLSSWSRYGILSEQLLFTRGGFRNLKELKIHNIEILKLIEFEMEAMPVLQKLVIINCCSVTGVIGIEFLRRLQEIQLYWVPKVFKELVKSDAERHENKPKFITDSYSDD